MRLLLVEDEEEAAQMLAKGLREHSYAVDLAPDGPVAVQKMFDNSYDLILLDVMLPGKDGISVCLDAKRKLRKSSYS